MWHPPFHLPVEGPAGRSWGGGLGSKPSSPLPSWTQPPAVWISLAGPFMSCSPCSLPDQASSLCHPKSPSIFCPGTDLVEHAPTRDQDPAGSATIPQGQQDEALPPGLRLKWRASQVFWSPYPPAHFVGRTMLECIQLRKGLFHTKYSLLYIRHLTPRAKSFAIC